MWSSRLRLGAGTSSSRCAAVPPAARHARASVREIGRRGAYTRWPRIGALVAHRWRVAGSRSHGSHSKVPPRKPASRKLKPKPTDEARRFVAERLRQARDERGLSQEALAGRAGVSSKFVGEVERAATNVSVGVVWQLCAGLGITPAEFFLGGRAGDVDDDVAVVTAIVRAQPPEARRQAIRLLRALYAS